jgi:large subunit ribosomal protein L32
LEDKMAVPKKRTSVARKGWRRAGQHHKLTKKTVVASKDTGEMSLPHRISPSGWYKGVKVFETKADREEEEEETTEE